MDAKITLRLNKSVIEKANEYVDRNNVCLSRLTEFLLNKVTSSTHKSLEELPISGWVFMVPEGEVEYQTKARKNKDLNKEYLKSKK